MAAAPPPAADGNAPARAITLRLTPELDQFYAAIGESLGGLSKQDTLSMVLSGLREGSLNDPSPELALLVQRFHHLFRVHDIAVTTVPAILHEYGFTLSVC